MEAKPCSQCGEMKPLTDYAKDSSAPTGVRAQCRACQNARNATPAGAASRKKWYESHYQTSDTRARRIATYYEDKAAGRCVGCHTRPATATSLYCDECVIVPRTSSAQWKQRNRQQVYEAYGGAFCACCGESEPRFLTLDHIANDGAEHRKAVRASGPAHMYTWLIKNNFPPGFQVLCWNCNLGKHFNHGVCPHQERSQNAED